MKKLFKSENINMTEGKPLRLLLAFAIPQILGNIFQQCYTVTDTAIVGRGVGITALAAIGAVDWLAWLPFCIPQGFTQGFAIMASQKYGEGDEGGVRRIVGQSVRMTIIMSVLCTAIGILGMPLFLQLMNVKEELRPLASTYLYFLFGGFTIAAFYNLTASMLRAVGDSRTPLIAMVISSLLNIALDAVVVFGFGWGVAGAAGATVFAQIVATVICGAKMLKTRMLCPEAEDLKRFPEITKGLFRLGAPMCLMNLIICIGGLIVFSVVNGFSISFIAGYTATNKLYGVLEMAAISYGYAVTTYVGQNYGAKKVDRIKKGVVTAVHLSVVTALFVGAMMILFGRQITGLFLSSDDPEVLALAGDAAYDFLKIMSIFLPVLYLLYAYRAALQGLGDTVSPLISGIVEFALRVGTAIYVGKTGVERGIFFAEVLAWAGAMLLLTVMYYVRRGQVFKKLRA